MLPIVLLSGALLSIGGRDRQAALEAQVQVMEAQIAALEAQNALLQSQVSACEGKATPEQEAEAKALYNEASQALEQGQPEVARALLRELVNTYPNASATRGAARILAELEVVGLPVGPEWEDEVLHWIQGEGEVDLGAGVTVVVFFEQWCPHCNREMPEIQALVDTYAAQGLRGLGLTRISKSSTPEKVDAFLDEYDIRFPIAQEDGDLSSRFAVTGIPAAMVVQDGEVVWRGHPAKLSNELVEGWL